MMLGDVNGNGAADLMLTFTGGGSVTLFGVSSLDKVLLADLPAAHTPSTIPDWALSLVEAYDPIFQHAVDGSVYGY